MPTTGELAAQAFAETDATVLYTIKQLLELATLNGMEAFDLCLVGHIAFAMAEASAPSNAVSVLKVTAHAAFHDWSALYRMVITRLPDQTFGLCSIAGKQSPTEQEESIRVRQERDAQIANKSACQ